MRRLLAAALLLLALGGCCDVDALDVTLAGLGAAAAVDEATDPILPDIRCEQPQPTQEGRTP